MVDDEFRIPILGEDGWEGGYKLEIFTVPRVWDHLRHLLGALGGGTGLHAGGTWKNDGRIYYDEDSEKISFFHDDPYTVNFVIGVGASLAYILQEKAILCVVLPSGGGWTMKEVSTEEEFSKNLPDSRKFQYWVENSCDLEYMPDVSLVMQSVIMCGMLEANLQVLGDSRGKIRKSLPDTDFNTVLETVSDHQCNAECKSSLTNISNCIDATNLELIKTQAKSAIEDSKLWEGALLNISELLARA